MWQRARVYIDGNVVYTHIVKTAVWGYHVYQVLWQPQIHDSFIAVHEEGNTHHKYAMAVYRSEEPTVVVGHLPREIAKACYYFSKHNGRITGVVTGRRVHVLVRECQKIEVRV